MAFAAGVLWTVADRVGGADGYRDDDVLGIILLLLQTLPIATRRVNPVASLAVSVVAISTHIAIGYQGVPVGTSAALIIL